MPFHRNQVEEAFPFSVATFEEPGGNRKTSPLRGRVSKCITLRTVGSMPTANPRSNEDRGVDSLIFER